MMECRVFNGYMVKRYRSVLFKQILVFYCLLGLNNLTLRFANRMSSLQLVQFS